MKKGQWEDSEVQDLFYVVEQVKDKNRPLKEAFIAHAQKYSRKPNSVRNFYYFQLLQLKKDIVRTKRLGIDLGKHEKVEIEYFTDDQQKQLVKDVDALVKEGYSIRKACHKLSGGDLDLMLRYQNKYRNYCAKRERPDNIITFTKKPQTLSEADINSLFMGLVRLVKRTAVEQYAAQNKQEVESASASLRKAIVDLGKKDRQLEKLKQQLVELKRQNSLLMQKMLKLKCDKAEKLSQNKG